MHLTLYESIDSTVENMTRDDKNEVLRLLRPMKNDKEDLFYTKGALSFLDALASLKTMFKIKWLIK